MTTLAATLCSAPSGPGATSGWQPGPCQATLIGSSSIFLWALWPSLAVFAAPTPTFQTLAIGLTVGFLCPAGLRLLRGQTLAGAGRQIGAARPAQ